MSVISALRRRSTVSNHSHPPVARSHRRSTSVSSPQQPQQEHHRRRSNSSSLNLHHAGILVAELLPSEKSMLVASAQATRHRRVSGQQVSPVMNHDQIACLEGPAPHSDRDDTRARRARDSYLTDPKLRCPVYEDMHLVQILWPAPPFTQPQIISDDSQAQLPIDIADTQALLTPKSKILVATPPWLQDGVFRAGSTVAPTAISIQACAPHILSKSGRPESPKVARRALTRAWKQVSSAFRRDGGNMPHFELVGVSPSGSIAKPGMTMRDLRSHNVICRPSIAHR